MSTSILVGDCRVTLPTLPERSVRCCVTSPPYWGLRDYGHGDQIGLESTPDAYVAEMVAVFREVRRVLTDDGTLWLNIGDSYCNTNGFARASKEYQRKGRNDAPANDRNLDALHGAGFKTKDLIGIPWRVAFALQADGWYLRSDIIWHKPNPMPESVTDCPTKAHEYVFLLAKSARYYYDAKAIEEESKTPRNSADGFGTEGKKSKGIAFLRTQRAGSKHDDVEKTGRNRRTVWTIATSPYKGAHFATMPPALAEPCILAGSAKGDTILDPFGGAGTTGLVADRLGRDAILCELNPTYAGLAFHRVANDSPLFSEVIR